MVSTLVGRVTPLLNGSCSKNRRNLKVDIIKPPRRLFLTAFRKQTFRAPALADHKHGSVWLDRVIDVVRGFASRVRGAKPPEERPAPPIALASDLTVD